MNVLKLASQINSLPLLNKLAPSANHVPKKEDLEGHLACQRLALRGAKEIASMIRPGWTEKKAASLYETWLRDNGADAFFHFPFVWWGDRAKF